MYFDEDCLVIGLPFRIRTWNAMSNGKLLVARLLISDLHITLVLEAFRFYMNRSRLHPRN